jgi:phosphohistidine phosphatase
MKRLIVLRHAKSSWDEPNLDDFDRPLNARGWKAARRMGTELKRRDMQFDLALASPALRVRETLNGLADGYGVFDFPIQFESGIYGAGAAALLDLVRTLPDGAGQCLLVGHNPGLQRLILELAVNDKNGLRDCVADRCPTAALAVIELAAQHWEDVAPGRGKLVELILPKELD